MKRFLLSTPDFSADFSADADADAVPPTPTSSHRRPRSTRRVGITRTTRVARCRARTVRSKAYDGRADPRVSESRSLGVSETSVRASAFPRRHTVPFDDGRRRRRSDRRRTEDEG
jgi:hypothetical protein